MKRRYKFKQVEKDGHVAESKKWEMIQNMKPGGDVLVSRSRRRTRDIESNVAINMDGKTFDYELDVVEWEWENLSIIEKECLNRVYALETQKKVKDICVIPLHAALGSTILRKRLFVEIPVFCKKWLRKPKQQCIFELSVDCNVFVFKNYLYEFLKDNGTGTEPIQNRFRYTVHWIASSLVSKLVWTCCKFCVLMTCFHSM